MIPKASESLSHISTRIAVDLIPKASDAYAGADLAFLTMMISMVGQDFERFADVHVREHAEMCAIFDKAMDHLPAALKARAVEARGLKAASLRASDLNARADITTRLLIDIHAFVEQQMDAGQAWANDLNNEIWAFLDSYAKDRAYEVPF